MPNGLDVNPHLEYRRAEVVSKLLEVAGYLTFGIGLAWGIIFLIRGFETSLLNYFSITAIIWVSVLLGLHTLYRYWQNRAQVDAALLLERQREGIYSLTDAIERLPFRLQEQIVKLNATAQTQQELMDAVDGLPKNMQDSVRALLQALGKDVTTPSSASKPTRGVPPSV